MDLRPRYAITETYYESGGVGFYRAERLADHHRVLLKTALTTDGPCVERLRREFTLCSDPRLSGCVRALALEEHAARTLLLLEDRGYEPLSRLVAMVGSTSLAQPPLARFLQLAIALTHAVEALHARALVHRSIKPEHVLFHPHTFEVALTGFDCAVQLPREPGACPTFDSGSVEYISPEQTGRSGFTIDHRTDLYSLGVTLFELRAGKPPFEGHDPLSVIHAHLARQPPQLENVAPKTPRVLSLIVDKLLAKAPEDRYQSAVGLHHDLELCQHRLAHAAGATIEPFVLGERDVVERLQIPHRLYGRDAEVSALHDAWNNLLATGRPGLVLVAGPSGIGKSAVVGELQRRVVRERGAFHAGKCDELQRGIPHLPLARALRSFLLEIMASPEDRVLAWRARLQEALGSHAQLVVDVVPELERLIGPQPEVPALSFGEAERRFHDTFQKFLQVLATEQRPFVLFLDDLQWVDAASLAVLSLVFDNAMMRHVLVVGAYRINEVTPTHPLSTTVAALRDRGVPVLQVTLSTLSAACLTDLTRDALRRARREVVPLAELIHGKTAGNPLFVVQFLTSLYEDGLLRFDHGLCGFDWNLEAIRARGFTDNVVELMVERLKKLPVATRHALELASCIGSMFELNTLAVIAKQPEGLLADALHDGMRAGVLLQEGTHAYRFVHDRVQQSAYSLIAAGQADEVHLSVGRCLLERATGAQLQEQIFAIVGHMSRGTHLLTTQAETRRVAELNLLASKRARAAVAYSAAVGYAKQGLALLGEGSWQNSYRLTLDLNLELAHSTYLSKDLERAEALLGSIAPRAHDRLDRAAVYEILVPLHTTRGHASQACQLARELLRELGVELPAHPTRRDVEHWCTRVFERLGTHPIEWLAELPPMRDPAIEGLMRVLTLASSPALFFDTALWALFSCERVLLTIEHGATSASAHACSTLALALLSVFADVERARRFGRLAVSLVDERGLLEFRAPVYLNTSVLLDFWLEPLDKVIAAITRTQRVGIESGALTYACYAASCMSAARLVRGDTLEDVARENDLQHDFLTRHRFSRLAESLQIIRLFVAELAGTGDQPLRAVETQMVGRSWRLNTFFYFARKLELDFLFGHHSEAIDAARRAQPFLDSVPGFVPVADYVTFAALAAAQCGDRALFSTHLQQLRTWAKSCPSTFSERAQLAEAELARLDGRTTSAMRLYESAIEGAHQRGFVQLEAVAAEVAARCYTAQGIHGAAHHYLRRAHAAYQRWGAFGKVAALERAEPQLARELAGTRHARRALTQIDLSSVMKASQTISGELHEDELTRTLVRVVLEQAGAQRGCLILARGSRLEIAAAAESDAHGVNVDLPSVPLKDCGLVPETLVQYVVRMGEPLILVDASVEGERFAHDPYIARRKVRSVLCLPVVRGVRTVGYLYLENSWVPGAFTLERLVIVESLATQAAIALENARLYAELRASEAKLTQFFEGLPVGVFIVDARGDRVFANRKATEIAGEAFDPTHIYVSGTDQLYAVDRTPFGRALRGQSSMTDDGEVHRDGRRVPVAIWGTPIYADDGAVRYAVIAFQDISAQRLAEAERARLVEHLQLAERLDSVGRLAGGVAHDLNNLLVPMLAYSALAMRALAEDDPVHAQVVQIHHAAERASELIRQLLAFGRRQILTPKELELGAELRALEPMLRRLLRADATLELHTDAAPSLVRADHSQIERAIVNLAINAVDAMGESGSLTITLQNVLLGPEAATAQGGLPAGPYALIRVADNGCGMDAQTRARIFEPFFTTKSHGTGLGLPTVYGLMKQHGGHVAVRSALGEGTTFEIFLPRIERSHDEPHDACRAQPEPPPNAAAPRLAPALPALDTSADARAASDEQPADAGYRATVLVVDDDPSVRAVLESMIAQANYHVVSSSDPEEALAMARELGDRLDVLVTDVMMPGLNGRELYNRIAQQHPSVRVLFVSGFAADVLSVEGVLEPGFELIPKPFSGATLRAKLSKVLSAQ